LYIVNPHEIGVYSAYWVLSPGRRSKTAPT